MTSVQKLNTTMTKDEAMEQMDMFAEPECEHPTWTARCDDCGEVLRTASRRGRSRARSDAPLVPLAHNARETSVAAAASVEPKAATRQADVLLRVRSSGSSGLTDWELECLTGLTHQSVSAARNALMNRGLVEDSGKRRKTKTGNQAIAWRAVK